MKRGLTFTLLLPTLILLSAMLYAESEVNNIESRTGQVENVSLKDLAFLVGDWKAENQNLYESWSKQGKQSLKGIVYKLDKADSDKLTDVLANSKNLQSKIQQTEALTLSMVEHKLTYQAQVFAQNDGAIINFSLNTAFTDGFSFENLSHDFPKKIQYKPINPNKILVTVKGAGDKGFSYHLLKVKKP